jgi:hypothetical protein
MENHSAVSLRFEVAGRLTEGSIRILEGEANGGSGAGKYGGVSDGRTSGYDA